MLWQFWNGTGRIYYHGWDHAQYMMGLAAEMKPFIDEDGEGIFEAVIVAILFHDAIYIPGSKKNEEMSAHLFEGSLRHNIDWALDRDVKQAILDTDYGAHNSSPAFRRIYPVSFWLQQLDLYPLIHCKELGLRKAQIANFLLVYEEFKPFIHDVGKIEAGEIKLNEDYAKEIFEKKQNEFLLQLSNRFGFDYEPVTWKDCEDAFNEEVEEIQKDKRFFPLK